MAFRTESGQVKSQGTLTQFTIAPRKQDDTDQRFFLYRRHLSIPQNDLSKYERCFVYDVDWTRVLESGDLMPNSSWPMKKCDGKWEFNFTDVPYETIATEVSNSYL